MAPTGLLESFVAAIQASLSVLLVIFYGGVAAWLGMLTPANTKAISKICVRMFLPALLFTKIGSELHAGSAYRYGVILVWALVCHAISFVLGIAGHLLFGMPDWTTVAVMFNNTTSYPLLLISALDQTGILQSLIGGDETTSAAIERAKSYFLVFSTVSSCLTFAVGPRLIDSEHAPEPQEESDEEEGKAPEGAEDEDGAANGVLANGGGGGDETEDVLPSREDGPLGGSSKSDTALAGRQSRGSSYDPLSAAPPILRAEPNEETALLSPSGGQKKKSSTIRFSDPFASSNAFFPSTRKPSIYQHNNDSSAQQQQQQQQQNTTPDDLKRRPSVVPKRTWRHLGPRTKWWLLFVADFFNAPMLGALVGAVVGLTPALHRAFFADQPDGGIFTAWLTASLDDIGGLFVPLPVVVAGVSLYTAMQEARAVARRKSSAAGNASPPNKLPWPTVISILVVRFILWPLASIGTIYLLSSRTELLGDDPMLWFTLMLMPTGPPAMKLITLVQVSNADEDDETSIAKLLTAVFGPA